MSIGIALGGGAGLGWAHIGVLQVLTEELGADIRAVAGTSIGAIVGGGFAAGRLDHVADVAKGMTFKNMLKLGQMGFGMGAMVGTKKIDAELRRHFGDMLIEDLNIPFAAVSSDLYTGKIHIDDKGELVEAMKASSAIPGLFPGIAKGDKLLVDGAIVEPVPVTACRALGVKSVIAVNLQDDYGGASSRYQLDHGRRPGVWKSARAAISISFKTIARQSLNSSQPELELCPAVGFCDPADFTRADELIEVGREAAFNRRDDIAKLIANCG